MFHGEVVEQVARHEVVGAVDEDRGAICVAIIQREEGLGVCACQVCGVGVDGDCRVDRGEALRRSFGFGQVDIGFAEEGLALEVGFFDDVAVDDGDGADACAGEEVCGDAAKCANARDCSVGCAKFQLAFTAYAGQDGLACVAGHAQG